MKRKTAVIVMALAAVLVLGGGSALAVGQLAKSGSIGGESAANFAFIDAGVLPEDALVTEIGFDFEKGVFVYEIEFIAQGVEYEYTVNAATGEVLHRSVKNAPVRTAAPARETAAPVQKTAAPARETEAPVQATAAPVQETAAPAPSAAPAESVPAAPADVQTPVPEKKPGKGKMQPVQSEAAITPEEARAIALADAGVSEAEAVFHKTKLERDDGRLIYDVEFHTAQMWEYEYEIDALTGEILEADWELWD